MDPRAMAALPLEETRLLRATRMAVAAVPCHPRHWTHRFQSDAACAQLSKRCQTNPALVPTKTRHWTVWEPPLVVEVVVVVVLLVLLVLLLL